MSEHDPSGPSTWCESGAVCVFAKALLARAAVCGLAARRSLGERELVECSSVVARTNCGTLAALMHERARFTLRLPSPGRPMIHAQALRLHCGGFVGLQHALGARAYLNFSGQRIPRMWCKLLHAQGNTLLVAIEIQYNNLNRLVKFEYLFRMVDTSPADIGYVE